MAELLHGSEIRLKQAGVNASTSLEIFQNAIPEVAPQ